SIEFPVRGSGGGARGAERRAHLAWLAEAAEQRLRGLELGGVEALGEPPVDRGQELTRRAGATLLMPQPGEADGAAQLHGQHPLPPRPVQRVLEMLLRPRGRRIAGTISGKQRASSASPVHRAWRQVIGVVW